MSKIIGSIPGFKALLKQIEEAETHEDALHILFSSNVITHEDKQLFVKVQEHRALGSSPMRNVMKTPFAKEN